MTESRPSIRRTLLIYLGALFLGGAIVLFVAARSYGRSAADISYDRLLTASALSIAESVSVVQGRWNVDLPYVALDALSLAPDDRVFYRVVAPEGVTLTGYGDLPSPPGPLDDNVQFFDADYRSETVRFAVLRRWVSRPASPGYAWVQVGQTRAARTALANDIALRMLLPIVLLTLVALPLVWFGIDRALRPVVNVETDLQRRDPSDLSPVQGVVPLELQHLVGALNGFIARLATNVEALRAFIAEAAHQMRTPLASLRAQAQLAVDEPNAADQRRSLQLVEANAARLGKLLDQLLSDAIVTHRSDLRRFGAVELADVVSEAVREVVPRAEPRPDVRLECAVAHAPVYGDALMLSEAVKNLVANALQHGSPESGAIHVALARHGDRFRLSVADCGPGIPAGQHEAVFERFQRVADRQSTRGAGLGLAIAKRVVDAHGGTIALMNREGGGLEVVVELPASGGAA